MKTVAVLALLALAIVPLNAAIRAKVEDAPAGGHQVTLTYSAPDAGALVNIYRANVACSTNPPQTAFVKVLTGQPQNGPAIDATITVVTGSNSWCYQATALLNGAESGPSNQANATLSVSPQPPTGLVATPN